MLVSVYDIDSLFTKGFDKIITIYNYSNVMRYVVYKKYLFLFVFHKNDEGVNVSISSDMCIFYNDDFTKINKKKLKKILDERISRN